MQEASGRISRRFAQIEFIRWVSHLPPGAPPLPAASSRFLLALFTSVEEVIEKPPSLPRNIVYVSIHRVHFQIWAKTRVEMQKIKKQNSGEKTAAPSPSATL